MKRYDKVPRRLLAGMCMGTLLHVMTPNTALRWATVIRYGSRYTVSAFDLRRDVEEYTTTYSFRRAAALAKRFAKEAA